MRMKRARQTGLIDYVRDLIRRDQERQDAIASIQQAIDEGVQSGGFAGIGLE